ncbi:hypothetical protein EYF80_043748 [Liparis tanakae]|uniref:Uncharacterized protein n=1 Tax=Liparis tanakae TaxID=230148 RepID=A0A4Z2FXV2_9TELE|nr:hypothetical protein EYF80_043748 [Liparis tanakae]
MFALSPEHSPLCVRDHSLLPNCSALHLHSQLNAAEINVLLRLCSGGSAGQGPGLEEALEQLSIIFIPGFKTHRTED